MDLEIIIVNQPDRERQISYDITCMWNLKTKIQMKIFTKQIDAQTQKTNLWLPKGKGERDKFGGWD